MNSARKNQRHELLPDAGQLMGQTRPVWEELRGNNVFLTGGTGFFGCWLLELFTRAHDHGFPGMRVTVLSRDPAAFKKRAPHLASHPSVTLHGGDIRSFVFPAGAFTHIIHGATDPGVALNKEDPGLMYETIVAGTARVREFAGVCGAQKMLLVSSGAVYGPQPPSVTHMPEDEAALAKPLPAPSAYAEGKREAETLWQATGGPVARCYAFVGPRMRFNGHYAIGNFIRDASSGQPIVIQGDGTARRSYLYASDLAAWLWTILCRGQRGRAYNVGSEYDLSIADLARAVAKNLAPDTEVRIAGTPVAGAQPEYYVPSTLRARSELGLRQTVGLDEAIRRTAAWYALHHPNT